MTTKTSSFLKQAVILILMFCIFATPSAMVLMTSRAFAKDAPQPSNSNSCKVTTNGIGYNYNPFDGRYFTQSGIEFWDDFEITNEWHTIATQGTNDYQAAVVYSNYFVNIIFEDRTNKVQLSSTLLLLEKVPMRTVLHERHLQQTNFWNQGMIYLNGN